MSSTNASPFHSVYTCSCGEGNLVGLCHLLRHANNRLDVRPQNAPTAALPCIIPKMVSSSVVMKYPFDMPYAVLMWYFMFREMHRCSFIGPSCTPIHAPWVRHWDGIILS